MRNMENKKTLVQYFKWIIWIPILNAAVLTWLFFGDSGSEGWERYRTERKIALAAREGGVMLLTLALVSIIIIFTKNARLELIILLICSVTTTWLSYMVVKLDERYVQKRSADEAKK